MVDFTCPKCNEKTSIGVGAAVADESRFILSFHPNPNSFMPAKSIGGALVEISKLTASVAIEAGGRIATFVEKVETMPGGELRFHLLTMPVRSAKKER